VNPVASSHFNFSVHEPTGVVTIIAPESPSLLGLVSCIMPVIAGGNTCVVLASENSPHVAVTFAEALNSSDLPGGVVNILTGKEDELADQFSSHMDVNATIYCRNQIGLLSTAFRLWLSTSRSEPYCFHCNTVFSEVQRSHIRNITLIESAI
jgi:hypothetical protein